MKRIGYNVDKRGPKIGWCYNSLAPFVVLVNGGGVLLKKAPYCILSLWSNVLIKIIILIIEDRQITQLVKCLLCKQ